MLVEVKVPVLAESVPDATLLEWKKREGEAVAWNEILIELETDKVVLEVPAPRAGVLKEIIRRPGDTVHSEEAARPHRHRGDGGGGLWPMRSEALPKGTRPRARKRRAAHARKSPDAPAPSEGAPRPSPAARKAAEEHRVDLSRVTGSGREGRITKEDVLAHVAAGATSAPAPGRPVEAAPSAPAREAPAAGGARASARGERRERMSRLRARIAERLKDAQNTAAILTTFNEVDMGPVMALRKRYREAFEEAHGVRLGFMSFFARASVQALRRFPAVNARIEGQDIVYHDYCDIGVAVGSPRGLVVPILRNVEDLSFAQIETKIGEFGAKARDGTLSFEEMSGGTFTISNGGVFGSLLSTPILNPPQSAILGNAQDGRSRGSGRRRSGGAPHDVSRALLRPPHHRRTRSGTLPRHHKGGDRGFPPACCSTFDGGPPPPARDRSRWRRRGGGPGRAARTASLRPWSDP